MLARTCKCFGVLAIVALMVAGAGVQAATITYDYGDGVIDACAISWNATYQCTLQEGYVGMGNLDNGGTPFTHAAVLKCDVSSMPAYTGIDYVTFKFWQKASYASGGSGDVAMYRVADTFAGWAYDANKTQKVASTSTLWDGGVTMFDVGTGSALATTTVARNNPVDTLYEWTVTGAAAQAMIEDWKSGTNSGVLFLGVTVATSGLDYRVPLYPIEDGNADFSPQVVVGYTPVPEPGTFALLGAGLVGLLAYAWRKRK